MNRLCRCVKNCAFDVFLVDRLVHIQAECQTCQSAVAYHWSLVDPNVADISQSSRLVLTAPMVNSFETHFEAEVTVESNNEKGLARIHVNRHNSPTVGKCFIRPKDGIELTTEFRIFCRSFSTTEPPLHFTVFQGETLIKWSAVNDFNVSLLNTVNSRFSEGSVMTEDALGAKSVVKLDIHVLPNPNPLNEIVQIIDLLNQTQITIKHGDFHRALLMLNFIGIAIVQLSNPNYTNMLIELVLDQLLTIELVQMHFTRMTIQSVMHFEYTSTNVTSGLALKLSILIRNSCKAMLRFYGDSGVPADDQLVIANTKDIVQLFDRVIKPFDTIPYVTDFQVPIPVDYPFTEAYPDYDNFRPEVLFTLKHMLNAIDNLNAALLDMSKLIVQMVHPEENDTLIRSGSVTLINKARDAGPIEIEDSNTKVVVESSTLGPLSVTAIIYRSNPYWWYPEATKLDSDVVMLFVLQSPTPITSLRMATLRDHQIHIYTQIRPVEAPSTHGIVAPCDDMPIYQLPVPANAVLTINFEHVCATLRVHLKANYRPKHYELVNEHNLISKENPQLQWTNDGFSSVTLYLAITPDAPSSFDDLCDFSFSTAINVCRTWHKDAWTTLDCVLGPNTTSDTLHCICESSQTVFTAQLYMAPNHLDLPRDLLLSLHNNQILIVFVVCLSCLFGVLMYLAWRQDRLDANRNGINYVHLSQQMHPNHQYLITVATGIQKNAATTSYVHLTIKGSTWSCSDIPLDLCNGFRKGTETKFLISTEQPFGVIQSIDVWIECNGREPSWFCDWIWVRDVGRQEDWIFSVAAWLSSVIGTNPSTRRTALLMSAADFYRKPHLFKMHFRHILTDRFMWYSIWMPFPRSPFTRKQRLLVAMASLATSMMTNVMFFGKTTKSNVEDENERYTKLVIALRMLSVIVQSMVISLVLGFVLTVLFKWTRRDQEQKKYRLIFRE